MAVVQRISVLIAEGLESTSEFLLGVAVRLRVSSAVESFDDYDGEPEEDGPVGPVTFSPIATKMIEDGAPRRASTLPAEKTFLVGSLAARSRGAR